MWMKDGTPPGSTVGIGKNKCMKGGSPQESTIGKREWDMCV